MLTGICTWLGADMWPDLTGENAPWVAPPDSPAGPWPKKKAGCLPALGSPGAFAMGSTALCRGCGCFRFLIPAAAYGLVQVDLGLQL